MVNNADGIGILTVCTRGGGEPVLIRRRREVSFDAAIEHNSYYRFDVVSPRRFVSFFGL